MRVKNLFLLGALTLSSMSLSAQDKPKEVFNHHWFMQLQGGAAHTLGEVKFKDLISPTAQFAVGYQFSPVFGMRLAANGWESKGSWVSPHNVYKYNYAAGNIDLMFNLSNAFCGYKPRRVFNVSAFVGGGVNYAFNNDDANALDPKIYQLEYLWDDNKISPVGRAGLVIDFRLSRRVMLGLEANANILTDKYNSKKAGNPDWYFNALAGLKIALGKPTKIISLEPETEVAPVIRKEEPTQPVVVKKEEPKKVVPEPKKPYRCDIFFKINSYVISAAESNKLAALAKYLRENPKTQVAITGYADAGTGNESINMRLSKARAESVQSTLVRKYGVDAARITKDYKGDNVQPFKDNDMNRVTICIAE